MKNSRKYFKGLPAVNLIIILMGISIISCNKTDAVVSHDDKYAILFYASGGDPEHDLSFMNTIELTAKACMGKDDVDVAVLFYASGMGEGEAHNGVRRYTSENGKLKIDSSFNPGENFSIVDPNNLTDFLKWGSSVFPDRKYILAFAGHGSAFHPQYEFPNTRATLFDGINDMTSVQFAQGVKNSGLELEALIANSCLQGSIETVAEWEGIGKYILFSSLRIPDISYDYTVLVEELHNDLPVEEALARTAKRTMDLWSMGYEAGLYATSVEVMRLTELQALWDAVSDAFEELRTSVNGVTFTVDPPAEFGQHFGTAYYKAYKYCLSTYAEDLYNLTAEQYVTDLQHFLKYAFSFSANLALTPYIHKLEDVLSEVVIAHYQADGKNNYRLNIYSPNDCVKGMSEYKKCRFDKLTSWSSVLEEMVKWKNTENNE